VNIADFEVNMSRTKTKQLSWGINRWISEVGVLVKWRLTMTVVFSSVVAFAIAAGTGISFLPAIILAVGGFLVAGSANAMNEILERDFDKLMDRTKDRPVARNSMAVSEAIVIAGVMLLVGVIMLAYFNPLTAFIGFVSFILYAFIYTPLKRYSTAAVAVGAIPGALPTLIGCVAFQGQVTWLAIILFLIQFIWQFPHFWAIGWLSFDQYKNAGFKLLPSTDGKIAPSLGLNSLFYSFLLIPVFGISLWLGVTDLVTTIAVMPVSAWFIYKSYLFYRDFDKESARKLMFSSFAFLPLVLCIILIGSLI
jgi:heme o synthase